MSRKTYSAPAAASTLEVLEFMAANPGARGPSELAKRHLAGSMALKGERIGILEMRRHLSCYFKGLPDFKETRLKLVTLTDPEELYRTLDFIADRWGECPAPEASSVYGS